MSSVPGDLMSCMSSCASSSICMRGQLHAFVALRLSVVYLGVVGGTGAIAVDGRRVDRGRIWAGRGDEVVGVRARRPWRVHQYVCSRQWSDGQCAPI